MDRHAATDRALVLKEGVRERTDGAEVEGGAVCEVLGEDTDASFLYTWQGLSVHSFKARSRGENGASWLDGTGIQEM